MWVFCLSSAEQDDTEGWFWSNRYDLDCVFSVCFTFRVLLVTEPWKLNTNPVLLMQYNVYKVQFLYLTTGGQQHAEREEDHSWCLTVVSTLKPQTEGDFSIKGDYQMNLSGVQVSINVTPVLFSLTGVDLMHKSDIWCFLCANPRHPSLLMCC